MARSAESLVTLLITTYQETMVFYIAIGFIGTALIGAGLYYFAGKSKSKSARNMAQGSRTTVVGATYGVECYLNACLNGLPIEDATYSDELRNEDKIELYSRGGSWNEHGYVLFRTSSGETFKCHLTGTSQQIVIETKHTERSIVQGRRPRSETTVAQLKNHIRVFIQGFGHYQLGINDCRNFASEIESFLSL